MNSTKPSKLRLRTILILSHLGLCSLSVGVTLALLNVHPIVGLCCLSCSIMCALYIFSEWGHHALRNLGDLSFTHKDGRLSIKYLKPQEIAPTDLPQEQDQVKW